MRSISSSSSSSTSMYLGGGPRRDAEGKRTCLFSCALSSPFARQPPRRTRRVASQKRERDGRRGGRNTRTEKKNSSYRSSTKAINRSAARIDLCILKTRLRSSSVLFFSSSSSFPSFHTTLCAVCDVMFPHLYRRRASDVSGEKTKMRNNAAAARARAAEAPLVCFLFIEREVPIGNEQQTQLYFTPVIHPVIPSV